MGQVRIVGVFHRSKALTVKMHHAIRCVRSIIVLGGSLLLRCTADQCPKHTDHRAVSGNKDRFPLVFFGNFQDLVVKANTAFPQMFSQKTHADSIVEALMRATGEKLKPMIYNDGASPSADESIDPVDSFIAKLNKHKIDFFVEE